MIRWRESKFFGSDPCKGAIRGNFHDILTDKVSAVPGPVDRETQRVGVRLDGNDLLVVVTGLYYLTNDEVLVIVHFGPDRIAVFYDDGTLWSEQPVYFQLAFAVQRIKDLAPEYPEWKETQPFKAVLENDLKSVLAGGEKSIGALVAASHSGITTDEFEATVLAWTSSARHPRFNKPYTDLVFQPMLEVLEYLRANGFKTYIVSGGGIDFMRPWAPEAYGIPREQIIGSCGKTKFELRDGKPVLAKLPEVEFIDDGPGKPVAIHRQIGRRPIMAFGNSDGDLQMLEWTAAGEGPRFCLVVHLTDADREWANDRESHIGRLDAALNAAQSANWTIVDMKNDWDRVYN